jgi:hypothetical protein
VAVAWPVLALIAASTCPLTVLTRSLQHSHEQLVPDGAIRLKRTRTGNAERGNFGGAGEQRTSCACAGRAATTGCQNYKDAPQVPDATVAGHLCWSARPG